MSVRRTVYFRFCFEAAFGSRSGFYLFVRFVFLLLFSDFFFCKRKDFILVVATVSYDIVGGYVRVLLLDIYCYYLRTLRYFERRVGS